MNANSRPSLAMCLLLTLTITGLTGFVHPVLCLESDGSVRLEMDASLCCAATAASPFPAIVPEAALSPMDGCEDCTDIHFSAKGTEPPVQGLSALPAPASGTAPRLPSEAARRSPLSPASDSPSPPPPSNLRC